ncbi:hypothetical protein W02_08670 [Nitrospira sp. KM1]|nr:hypothetical protein W02_08670 [Nitrospira sp. KM1]
MGLELWTQKPFALLVLYLCNKESRRYGKIFLIWREIGSAKNSGSPFVHKLKPKIIMKAAFVLETECTTFLTEARMQF